MIILAQSDLGILDQIWARPDLAKFGQFGHFDHFGQGQGLVGALWSFGQFGHFLFFEGGDSNLRGNGSF